MFPALTTQHSEPYKSSESAHERLVSNLLRLNLKRNAPRPENSLFKLELLSAIRANLILAIMMMVTLSSSFLLSMIMIASEPAAVEVLEQ
jgi:hypothetical protein